MLHSSKMINVKKYKDNDSIKCNKCVSTNVSVSSFGDRTGVNSRDCGKCKL